jgi:hypothetical protein
MTRRGTGKCSNRDTVDNANGKLCERGNQIYLSNAIQGICRTTRWPDGAISREAIRVRDSQLPQYRTRAYVRVHGTHKRECFPRLPMNGGTQAVPSRAVSFLVQTMV